MERVELLPEEQNDLEEQVYNLTRDLEVAQKGRAAAIKEGDLSENASFEAYTEQVDSITQEIERIERILSNCIITDISKIDRNVVSIGTKVRLVDNEGEVFNFHYVGDDRGDVLSNKISRMSLVGKAIYGKSINSRVMIRDNNGKSVEYTIESIE